MRDGYWGTSDYLIFLKNTLPALGASDYLSIKLYLCDRFVPIGLG